MNLEEEEAAESHAACSPSEKLQKSAWIARKEDGAEKREEEGTQAKRSEWESRSGTSMLGPVEGGRLDGSSKGHATT